MIVDYKNSIYGVRNARTYELDGFQVGGIFLPLDLIKQLYEKANTFETQIEKGKCKPIPDLNEYEYYQFDGNIDAIKNVEFLKKYNGTFEIGGNGFGKYHLDYQEQDEVYDIFPGDYIVNKVGNNCGISISIYREEEFKKNFKYK